LRRCEVPFSIHDVLGSVLRATGRKVRNRRVNVIFARRAAMPDKSD